MRCNTFKKQSSRGSASATLDGNLYDGVIHSLKTNQTRYSLVSLIWEVHYVGVPNGRWRKPSPTCGYSSN